MSHELKLLSLKEAKNELLHLKDTENIHTPHWTISEICLHCAQTIDYSMTGYPAMKPALIRNTIGKIALRKFLHQGYMKHDLTAHVPGGSKLDSSISSEKAIQELMDTMKKFESNTTALKPHLLFGNLTKIEYDQYFAMHIADHLSELDY